VFGVVIGALLIGFIESSNGGVFGSLYGTPIINLPQSAVLGACLCCASREPYDLNETVEMIGMHATKDRPVVVDGQIVIRPIMIVALTYDHRLLDGREAVTFLGAWRLFVVLVLCPEQPVDDCSCCRGNIQ
jgi:2-oxoglutarate dehydrogenase E2 component (dihydrolipoamide succinyltransferase)